MPTHVIALGLHATDRLAHRFCNYGFQLHGGLDGIGGRGEDRPPHPALGREARPPHHRLGVRGRPHAGGRALADADGQDLRRNRPAPLRPYPLRLDPHESHHRWRVGVVRDAGRRDPGRAGGGDRVRRSARDQADHRAGPAAWIPDRRIPARARRGGCRRAAQRAPRHHGPVAPPHGRPPTGGGGRLSRLSFEDACRFLFARQGSRIKWSLGPTEGLLGVLGHPERGFPCVHVAGTNGKGSTCAFVAAELRARGLRVGLYTSPHLVSVRERVAVNGVLITEEAFADWTSTLQPHIGPVGDAWPESFAHAYVAGRFEVRGKWIFDVAHNPDGARVLAQTLHDTDPARPRRALVGVLGDKDYLGMIECLAEEIDGFVFTMPHTAPTRRRWDLRRVGRELGRLHLAHEFEPDCERALERG